MLIVNKLARAPYLLMIGMFNYQIWHLWIWRIVIRKVCFRGKLLQIYSFMPRMRPNVYSSEAPNFFYNIKASRLAQDDKEKPTSLVVREICPPIQMQPTTTTQGTDPPEQSKIDTVNATSQTQGTVTKKSLTLQLNLKFRVRVSFIIKQCCSHQEFKIQRWWLINNTIN